MRRTLVGEATLVGRELEVAVSEPGISGLTLNPGDGIELRFAPAGVEGDGRWQRQMPIEGVSRVLGLIAATGGSYAVRSDTDGRLKQHSMLMTSDIKTVIDNERNGDQPFRGGNALAAVLINGEPAEHKGRRAARSDMSENWGLVREYKRKEAEAVAAACRRGDLRWEDVPKGMMVDILFGVSVYAAESDRIRRLEKVDYGVHLRSEGNGIFQATKSESRMPDHLSPRSLPETKWHYLSPGSRVQCFSGRDRSGLALARASVSIAGVDDARVWETRRSRVSSMSSMVAVSPLPGSAHEERRPVRGEPGRNLLTRSQNRRGLATRALALIAGSDISELQRYHDLEDRATEKILGQRVLNIDFGGVPTNEYESRETTQEYWARQRRHPAYRLDFGDFTSD